MTHNLGETHDRELVGGRPGLAAGREHPRTGHAKAVHVRDARPQRCDQRGAELIARGFSRDDTDTQRFRGGVRDPTKSSILFDAARHR